MRTVAILPGFSEGGWHVKRLVRQLDLRHYQLIEQPAMAEVIITHSAGCYLIPKIAKPQLLMIIGAPYWPGRSIGQSIWQSLVLDAAGQIRQWGFGGWLNKLIHNVWYVVSAPQRSIKIWRSLRQVLIHESVLAHKILLIRNLSDPFCSSQLADLAQGYANARYIELPGYHEDCWFNPKPYADLLNQVL